MNASMSMGDENKNANANAKSEMGENANEGANEDVNATAKKACAEALRRLALNEPGLARAAAEGYDVTRKMLDCLADSLCLSVPEEHIIGIVVDQARGNVSERSAPDTAAFAVHDRIATVCSAANETLPTEVGRWKASRIVRADLCPHPGRHHFVTAVLARLETPLGAREIIFTHESTRCVHVG